MRRFIVNAVSDVIAEQPCLQGGPEDDALLVAERAASRPASCSSSRAPPAQSPLRVKNPDSEMKRHERKFH